MIIVTLYNDDARGWMVYYILPYNMIIVTLQ